MFSQAVPPETQLAAFFDTCRGHPPHIEFHPSMHHNEILVANHNILIPKSLLIKAFISANATFTSLLERSTDPAEWSIEEARTLLDTSLVLILVGAENRTAVNTRRRVLLRDLGEVWGVVTPREEIRLLEGVLTSPLPKHNKSPLLWHYRRWLVERYGVGILGQEGLKREIEVVQKSGDVHPRNYYAWNYARFITTTFYSNHPKTSFKMVDFVTWHAGFCLRHVSDTSCWSFLLFLFSKASECEEPSTRIILFGIMKDVMCFAHDIARGHESIWEFLKTVLACGDILGDEQRRDLVKLAEGWVGQQGGNGKEEVKEIELERKALVWIRKREASKFIF